MPGSVTCQGSRVDLRISASGLRGKLETNPNAFVVVFVGSVQSGETNWEELARSEIQNCDSCPTFTRIFTTEFRFELYQPLRIVLFDKTEPSHDLTAQYLIGVCDTAVGDVAAARGDPLKLRLCKDEGFSGASVSISAEEVGDSKKEITIQFSCSDLMTLDEAEQQREYLEHLPVPVKKQSALPEAPWRPGAALMGLMRGKEVPAPAVRPTSIENIARQKQQELREQELELSRLAAEASGPPPFVPYVVISAAQADAVLQRDWYALDIEWEEVYRSQDVIEVKDNTGCFELRPISISQMALNGGDDNRLIRIAVMKLVENEPCEIGAHVTRVSTLRATWQRSEEMVSIGLRPQGMLHIMSYAEKVLPSFLDLLNENMLDLSLIVGIDFTQSNGRVDDPSSLHFQPPASSDQVRQNPYEAAMSSVSRMVADYSSDKRIAGYGFGAKIPPQWHVSHCFSLTGHPSNPLCEGTEGLLSQYRTVLQKVQPWGPTMFSELLATTRSVVSRSAASTRSSAVPYTCLLIVTDGVISDFDKTRSELVKLSAYPVSVIIIGVGSENFHKMHVLDDSEPKPLLQRGNAIAVRRFVRFIDFASLASDSGEVDFALISETVLGCIPSHGAFTCVRFTRLGLITRHPKAAPAFSAIPNNTVVCFLYLCHLLISICGFCWLTIGDCTDDLYLLLGCVQVTAYQVYEQQMRNQLDSQSLKTSR